MVNHTLPRLIPPFRFSIVEDKLYRGGYPTLRNFRFLRRLELKTICSIIPEAPTCDLADFAETENINLIWYPASKFTSDSVTVDPAKLAEILNKMIDPTQLPLYIHCLDGSNVTGISVMMLRKLQLWETQKLTFEYCRFTRDQTIEKEETEFVQSFHEEIIIPDPVASWLWPQHTRVLNAAGGQTLRHPSLRLRWAKDQTPVASVVMTTATSPSSTTSPASSRLMIQRSMQFISSDTEKAQRHEKKNVLMFQRAMLLEDKVIDKGSSSTTRGSSTSRLLLALDLAGFSSTGVYV